MDIPNTHWEIENEGQDVVKILDIGHNHYVCTLSGWAQPFQDEHARLIATAPDLLKACEIAMALIEEKVDEWELIEHDQCGCNEETCALCLLRKAIQKAKGE